MYIPMPSPRGTNKAGLFIPARFGAAYNSRRGLARDELPAAALSTSPNSGAPMGRRAEDDEDEGGQGEREHPAHEILRRARASLSADDCYRLKTILGRLIMAENDQGRPEEEATIPSEPIEGHPDGEMDPTVKRTQDAAWQHFLALDAARKRAQTTGMAFDATAERRKREQTAAAVDMALIPLPRDLTVRYATPRPRVAYDAATDADFAKSHPEVARIRCI